MEKERLLKFEKLLGNAIAFLNHDALIYPAKYRNHGGKNLEDDVVNALICVSKNTEFENTIEKISGQRFPDIIVASNFGVEVKSTKEDKWTSTGSSINESTRVQSVSDIYIVFAKLGGQIEFKYRRYEEVLTEIVVTHMPRYQIDMMSEGKDTIFYKMGISYEKLRKMSNPVSPVSAYYKSKLKPGETLWWLGDDDAISIKIKDFSTLSHEEKKRYTSYALVNFPEVIGGDYSNYSLYLTSRGISDFHVRDQFSAGGKIELILKSGKKVLLPAVFKRIISYKEDILHYISIQKKDNVYSDKFNSWKILVAHYAPVVTNDALDALDDIFSDSFI